MRMHATSPCVNAQGSDEARHHGPRPLQMSAERPRLVCVGTKLHGKVSLQAAADLPRRRRPVVIDIQPEPTSALRFNDREVAEPSLDYDPKDAHERLHDANAEDNLTLRPDEAKRLAQEGEGGWAYEGQPTDEDETEEEYWARVALDDQRDQGMTSYQLDDRDPELMT